ncbi:MAG TPA: hypothetical protein VFZ25_15885 [Chloroflexota bacterium]|nr:hypothetical protein [Chloroflexota bacterium]
MVEQQPLSESTRDALREQLGDAFARQSDAEQARDLALLEAIRRPGDVALDYVVAGDRRWSVTVCAGDFPGALSLIVGLLAANRLEILHADIVTLHLPLLPVERRARRRPSYLLASEPPAPRQLIFDRFEVHAPAELGPRFWDTFQTDLATLLGAPEGAREEATNAVIDRISRVIRALGPPDHRLLPLEIAVTNDAGTPTRLSVRSVDTPGFLFAFANALAGITVNVERAEIRTVDGEARDTFWVTDLAGRPIVDAARVHELRVATTLIKQFIYLLPRSPDPGQALRQFKALISQILSRPDWTREFANLEAPAVLETLATFMGVSQFLWEDFLRLQHESLFPVLLDVPALAEARDRDDLRAELGRRLAGATSPDERARALNAFKDQEMFRVDLRHITGRSEFGAFSRELAALAEVAVETAIGLAADELTPKYGRPTLPDGSRCPLVACAMGKFGGEELGFGSDLELIFVYESQGTTDGPQRVTNSEYFERLVQTFLHKLWARQEGIFEIDLRLRPYGRAGALATSLDGFRQYYAVGGDAQQFERLALVRLRPLSDADDLAQRVRRLRDSFVYSGAPLDLANVRHLRHRQATELVPRGQVNAKYSPGGLVDVEYFVQSRQIAVGAADASVRVSNTRDAIARLEAGGYLSQGLAREIDATYVFLRGLIDALRVVRGNAKDLTIPAESSREFAYLAQRTGREGPRELRDTLTTRMAFARSLWENGP